MVVYGDFGTELDICGLIIEKGIYPGGRDLKILWNNGTVETSKSSRLRVALESSIKSKESK